LFLEVIHPQFKQVRGSDHTGWKGFQILVRESRGITGCALIFIDSRDGAMVRGDLVSPVFQVVDHGFTFGSMP
jgi:hypothetical protein